MTHRPHPAPGIEYRSPLLAPDLTAGDVLRIRTRFLEVLDIAALDDSGVPVVWDTDGRRAAPLFAPLDDLVDFMDLWTFLSSRLCTPAVARRLPHDRFSDDERPWNMTGFALLPASAVLADDHTLRALLAALDRPDDVDLSALPDPGSRRAVAVAGAAEAARQAWFLAVTAGELDIRDLVRAQADAEETRETAPHETPGIPVPHDSGEAGRGVVSLLAQVYLRWDPLSPERWGQAATWMPARDEPWVRSTRHNPFVVTWSSAGDRGLRVMRELTFTHRYHSALAGGRHTRNSRHEWGQALADVLSEVLEAIRVEIGNPEAVAPHSSGPGVEDPVLGRWNRLLAEPVPEIGVALAPATSRALGRGTWQLPAAGEPWPCSPPWPPSAATLARTSGQRGPHVKVEVTFPARTAGTLEETAAGLVRLVCHTLLAEAPAMFTPAAAEVLARVRDRGLSPFGTRKLAEAVDTAVSVTHQHGRTSWVGEPPASLTATQ